MAAKLSSTFTLSLPSDREIVLTRLFDAPRDLVFKACASCEHISRWWGPRFLTMVSCEMDFQPGGKYRFVLRSADGAEHGFRGEYREIVPPERVAQTFEFEGMLGHISNETLTLEEQADGKTKLTVRSIFSSTEDRDGMVQSGMEAGVRDTYDRLEEFLEAHAAVLA